MDRVDSDISALIEQLRREDPSERCQAACALAFFGPDARGAIPPLIEMAGADEKTSAETAALALYAVGQDAAAAVPVLAETVLARRGARRRVAAILALVKVGPSSALAADALVRAVSGDRNHRVRFAAALALGVGWGDVPGAVQALAETRADGDEDVRVVATVAHACATLPAEKAVRTAIRAARRRQVRPRLFGPFCAAAFKILRLTAADFLPDAARMVGQIRDLLAFALEAVHFECFGNCVETHPDIAPRPRVSPTYLFLARHPVDPVNLEFLREAIRHPDPVTQAGAHFYAACVCQDNPWVVGAIRADVLVTGLGQDHLLTNESTGFCLKHVDAEPDPALAEAATFRHDAFYAMYSPALSLEQRAATFVEDPFFLREVRGRAVEDLRRAGGVFRNDPPLEQLDLVCTLLFEELARTRKLIKPEDYLALPARLRQDLSWRLRDYYRDFYGLRRKTRTTYLGDDGSGLPADARTWDPGRELEAEEMTLRCRDDANAILLQLDDLESLVIRARFMENKPAREIATLVGLPVHDVYQIVERVKKRLRYTQR